MEPQAKPYTLPGEATIVSQNGGNALGPMPVEDALSTAVMLNTVAEYEAVYVLVTGLMPPLPEKS